MAISAIHDWLTLRGPYQRGIELLKLHGNPSAAQRLLFDLPESTFTRSKLEAALRSVNEANPAPQPRLRAKPAVAPVITADDDVDTRVHKRLVAPQFKDLPVDLLPKELRPLREQLKKDWREYTYTRGTMRNIPDGMHLRQVAEHVLALKQKMRAGWWVIEHWRKTASVVKLDAEQRVANPVDLRRIERKLSTWISQRENGHRKDTKGVMESKRDELQRVRELLKKNAVPA
jgi:hypothetical protein